MWPNNAVKCSLWISGHRGSVSNKQMYDEVIVVYLAHPFAGNPAENLRRVTRIAKRIIAYLSSVNYFSSPATTRITGFSPGSLPRLIL